jgi:hypothetical protein
MKKSLLLSCVAFVSLSLQAQIEKGNTLLGGSFGFGTNQSGQQFGSSSNSNIQPYIQFAYKANRTIGFGLDFYYSSNQANEGQNKQENFSLAPAINFTQYHPIKGNFGWLLQEYAGVGLNSTKITNGTDIQKGNSTSVFAGITPGIYYAVGEKRNWLLQANVGNLGASYNKQSNADNSTFSVHTNLFQSYRFGFAYIFGK